MKSLVNLQFIHCVYQRLDVRRTIFHRTHPIISSGYFITLFSSSITEEHEFVCVYLAANKRNLSRPYQCACAIYPSRRQHAAFAVQFRLKKAETVSLDRGFGTVNPARCRITDCLHQKGSPEPTRACTTTTTTQKRATLLERRKEGAWLPRYRCTSWSLLLLHINHSAGSSYDLHKPPALGKTQPVERSSKQ